MGFLDLLPLLCTGGRLHLGRERHEKYAELREWNEVGETGGLHFLFDGGQPVDTVIGKRWNFNAWEDVP